MIVVIATLNFAKSHFGRLDIVVNNVGIVDEGHWERVLDINLVTVTLTLRAGTCTRHFVTLCPFHDEW